MKNLTAIVLLFAGIVIAFIALFLPPPGEIHESVILLFAQILIYVGSIFGIEAAIKGKTNERVQDTKDRGNTDDRGDKAKED